MSERDDDTPEPPAARHRVEDAPRGSYYYDDATNYLPYNPDEEDEEDEEDEDETDEDERHASHDINQHERTHATKHPPSNASALFTRLAEADPLIYATIKKRAD